MKPFLERFDLVIERIDHGLQLSSQRIAVKQHIDRAVLRALLFECVLNLDGKAVGDFDRERLRIGVEAPRLSRFVALAIRQLGQVRLSRAGTPS